MAGDLPTPEALDLRAAEIAATLDGQRGVVVIVNPSGKYAHLGVRGLTRSEARELFAYMVKLLDDPLNREARTVPGKAHG